MNTPTSLESLDSDILYLLCEILDNSQPASLKSLSQTNRLLRNLALPILFKEVEMRQETVDEDRFWDFFTTNITKLHAKSHVHQYIKSFSLVSLNMHTNDPPPIEVMPLFIEILQRLPRLRHLNLELPQVSCLDYAIWQSSFYSAGLEFPLVDTLAVGHYCDFVVSRCPNVSSVSRPISYHIGNFGDGYSLIRVALMAEKVTTLHFPGLWQLEWVDLLLATPNNISALSTIDSANGVTLQRLLLKLSQLSRLQSLTLSSLHDLGLGFRRCKQYQKFTAPSHAANFQAYMEKGRGVEESVVRMVDEMFGKASALNMLRFEANETLLSVRKHYRWDGVPGKSMFGEGALYERVSSDLKESDEGRVGKWVRRRSGWL